VQAQDRYRTLRKVGNDFADGRRHGGRLQPGMNSIACLGVGPLKVKQVAGLLADPGSAQCDTSRRERTQSGGDGMQHLGQAGSSLSGRSASSRKRLKLSPPSHASNSGAGLRLSNLRM
jgi:hypothetical protein